MMVTDSLVVFTDKVKEIIDSNAESLTIHSVFYGDQDKLPGSPVVCIEPDTKTVNLKNAQRGVEILFRVYILVYSALIDSPITNRRTADTLAEQLEALLNADGQLGDLVTHSMVEEVASGYARKADTIVRANRITFTGRSQSRLPS